MKSLAVAIAFLGMLMCGANAENELRLHVSVPNDLSAQANSRSSVPVLMLQGLEFGAKEGFKIEVLAEDSNSPGTPIVLGTSALVGHPQSTPQPPLQKIDLPIPLNEKGTQFLACKSEVNLIVRFERTGAGRPPIKVDR